MALTASRNKTGSGPRLGHPSGGPTRLLHEARPRGRGEPAVILDLCAAELRSLRHRPPRLGWRDLPFRPLIAARRICCQISARSGPLAGPVPDGGHRLLLAEP